MVNHETDIDVVCDLNVQVPKILIERLNPLPCDKHSYANGVADLMEVGTGKVSAFRATVMPDLGVSVRAVDEIKLFLSSNGYRSF